MILPPTQVLNQRSVRYSPSSDFGQATSDRLRIRLVHAALVSRIRLQFVITTKKSHDQNQQYSNLLPHPLLHYSKHCIIRDLHASGIRRFFPSLILRVFSKLFPRHGCLNNCCNIRINICIRSLIFIAGSIGKLTSGPKSLLLSES